MSSSQSKKCCVVQASKRAARPKEAIANVLGVNAADSGRTSGVSSSVFPFSVVIFRVGREWVQLVLREIALGPISLGKFAGAGRRPKFAPAK